MQDQVDRVVQFVKYADKVIVTEANSTQKQASFTQKLLSNLPRQIKQVEIDAYSHSPAALLQQISQQVGANGGDDLTALAQRARTVFNHGQRLVVVINQAQFWLDAPHDQALAELIQVFAQQASQSLIFILNAEHGTSERIGAHAALNFISGDLYRLELDQPRAQPDIAIDRDDYPTPTGGTPLPHEQPPWKNPTLLMVGGVSLLVIGVGMYSIISRMSGPTATRETPQIEIEEEITDQQPAEHVDLTKPAPAASREQQDDWHPPTPLAALNDAPEAPSAQPTDRGAIEEPQPAPVPQTPADTEPEPEPAEPAAPIDAPDTPEPQTTPQPAQPAASAPTESIDEAAVAVTDNQWFANQPRARAVIQLAAFGSEERARDFIREHAVEHGPVGEYRIFTQLVNERLLFTVTYGNFASSERAEHDINTLPERLRSLEPYARSIGAVRDRIQQ